MLMSDLFQSYIVRLTPTEPELERARAHRDLVQQRITLEGVIEFVNSGSYIKSTAIRPFNDIDLFVGFASDAYAKNPNTVIHRLAHHLKQSFPGKVRIQRRSVGVTFADDVRVDVVPGFAVPSRPGLYRIRDRSDQSWVETNIVDQKKFFRRRQAQERRFRDMVRLVKAWKQRRRLKISSYLMELLVAKAFANGIPRGRDVALHQFFSWLATEAPQCPIVFDDFYSAGDVENIPKAPLVVLDPTNWRNNVASSLSAQGARELLSVADRSRARSGTALDATSRREAAAIWRDILPQFPWP